MARLNLEDQFWLDIMTVAVKIGDQDKAIGNAARWFRFAQEKHKSGQLVTEDEFRENGFLPELIPTFATKTKDGIIARGASKHFGWLDQRKLAGHRGGKASAKSRNSKDKEPNSSKTKQTQANDSKTKQVQPSISISSSISSSFSNSRSTSSSSKNTNTVPEAETLGARIWESYRRAYENRYHETPVRNAKVNAQIKQLGKRLGNEAPDVVAFFVSHPKTFYVGKLHDIGLCLADAEALRTQWAKGKAITNQDLKRYEQNQAFADIIEASREGKI